MAKNTGISWVSDPETLTRGRTWNPVTGCDKISDGCDNCYALTTAARLQKMGSKRYLVDGDPATSGPGFGVTLHEDLVDAPRHWRNPTMCFVNSMSDLFHARVPVEFVARVFATMTATPQHTYQVLTKRASRLPKLLDRLEWPSNLWMGVTVEDEAAMSRIDALVQVPATVRFLSAEPLLGPLPGLAEKLDGIDWVIVGGESGAGARPMDPAWVADIRAACAQTGTAFFFKQTGTVLATQLGLAKKGDKPDEWPGTAGALAGLLEQRGRDVVEVADLFVQQFPTGDPTRVAER